jgi:3-oxoacyl-[acyl-carrier-protein] synthase II
VRRLGERHESPRLYSTFELRIVIDERSRRELVELSMPSTERALRVAGVTPEDVGYINAHATSTPAGDVSETRAIRSVFGEHAYSVAVSSTRSMTGHLFGAAGAVEAIAMILAVRDVLPSNINKVTPDLECNLHYVPNEAPEARIEVALSNGFGFGGHNAVVAFRRASWGREP